MALFAFTFLAAAAEVNGKYTGEMTTQRGPQTMTFNFKTTGTTVEGTTTGRGGETPLAEGKIDGDKITFSVTRQGRDGTPQKTTYTGTIKGDSIELTFEGRGGPQTLTLKKAM